VSISDAAGRPVLRNLGEGRKPQTRNPQAPHFYNNLGVALKALGKYEEAVQAFEKVLSLKPGYANAHFNLGNVLALLNRYEIALEQYEIALSLKPDNAFTYYNIAVTMQNLDRHAEAVKNFKHTIDLGHNDTEVSRAMAASQKALGRYTHAISTLRQALHIKPHCGSTHTDLGMLLLLIGNFAQGWSEYRWRLKNTSWGKHFPDTMRWDGSNFAGKKLLVRCEQGLGDNIHFVRYLPLVKERGGTVIFGVYDQLYNLLKDFPGVDETVNLSIENQHMEFDLYAPIMDLPGNFNTTLETIPSRVPYIFADPVKVRHWRNQLAGPDFKVGIVWSGSSGKGGKHLRNCELADFARLASIDGIKLYSLQKGQAAEQLEQLRNEFPVVNLGRHFNDFSDTAAAIENLDLIISVDTSVLHLAGAMGKSTWALQHFSPDWRWMLDRDDSPWYPTMKLFRQKELNHWENVFSSVEEQLRTLLTKQTPQEPYKLQICKKI